MSTKTSEEKESKKSIRESFNYKNILICSCGEFEVISLRFKKKNYYIYFPCVNFKLTEIDELSEVHVKCKRCKKEILIDTDYYEKGETNTIFTCKNCASRFDDKKKKKLSLISNLKNINDEKRKEMANKFSEFINNNGKGENDFYNNNLEQVQLFKNFVDYLFFLRQLYSKDNKIHKIISNFLDYSENVIDIAIKNINIYDFYHFNKAIVIYSYCNDKKYRFFSSEFQNLYNKLLINCEKSKYLSIEMLKYIYNKYDKEKLVDYLFSDVVLEKYCKIKSINVGRRIFKEANELRMKYLNFKLLSSEMENKSETINLKTKICQLEGELKLDKYINSFLEVPGQFSLFRKSASIFLNKIINNNQEKLKFISPSETVINSTLYLTSKIKKELAFHKAGKISKSIKDKLLNLEKILENYKYRNIKSSYKKEETLKYPLIDLNEEEKKFLAKNLKKESEEKKPSKIIVSDIDDKDLEFIINYLFELRDDTSEIIHVTDKEMLKHYSFPDSRGPLPEKKEDDDLKAAIKNINTVIECIPKYGKVSYAQLIDFMFGSKKDTFFKMENKIDYLLTFLNIKISKLSDIKNDYIKMKNTIMTKVRMTQSFLNSLGDESDEEKNEKFLKKYKIKVNSEAIFEYLDFIFHYIYCKMEEEMPYDSDNNLDDYKPVALLDIAKIFKDKEEKMRNKIIDLFQKDKKFINYIINYLNTEFKKFFEEGLKEFNDNLYKLEKEIMEKNLLYLKSEKIREIIFSLKLYNFDIETHYNDYVLKITKNSSSKKYLKINENEKKIVGGIENFDNFIATLKKYIGDTKEQVEIIGKEPSQFVFNLFLQKIGLNWA